MSIGALLIAMAGYEGAAFVTHRTLISHARGPWRVLIVAMFAVFVGHVLTTWARDDREFR